MPAPDIAWADLALLLAALEHGSLSRASSALGISQSTASRRLDRLEAQLGARVFERTPEGLLPTALAHQLAPHAELMAGHLDDIARIVQGQEARPAGRVRLAVVDGMTSPLLVPRLGELYARHPELRLDLVAGQAVLDLVRGEADIALRVVRPTAPDLVVRRLGQLDLAAYAHPSLLHHAPAELPWIQLRDNRQQPPWDPWVQEHASADQTTRVNHWNVLFACASAGVGAAVLPGVVAEPAGLVRLDLPLPPPFELFIVYHRALRDVPRIAAVRDWLVEVAQPFVRGAETP